MNLFLDLYNQAVQTDWYEPDDHFPTGRSCLHGAQAVLACLWLLPGENDLTQ